MAVRPLTACTRQQHVSAGPHPGHHARTRCEGEVKPLTWMATPANSWLRCRPAAWAWNCSCRGPTQQHDETCMSGTAGTLQLRRQPQNATAVRRGSKALHVLTTPAPAAAIPPTAICYLQLALLVGHVSPEAAAMVLGLAAVRQAGGWPLRGAGRQPCPHWVAPAHGCWAALPVIKCSRLASSEVRATALGSCGGRRRSRAAATAAAKRLWAACRWRRSVKACRVSASVRRGEPRRRCAHGQSPQWLEPWAQPEGLAIPRRVVDRAGNESSSRLADKELLGRSAGSPLPVLPPPPPPQASAH